MITYVMIVLACAVLNRIRGGGFYGELLPGHPRYWVSPVLGLVNWIIAPWPVAASMAFAYLIWSIPPWGRWYDLNRVTTTWITRDYSSYERVIERLSGKDDYLSFYLRHLSAMIGIVLLAYLTTWWWYITIPVLPLLIVCAYDVAWRISDHYAITIGEMLTGAAWGIMIVMTTTMK